LCASDGAADDEWLAHACTLLDNWSEDFATRLARQKMIAARADHEVEPKTVWWQHVHVDALWPLMRAQDSGFGVFGTHVTMDVHGRFQIFTAPGFIMLNVPSINGRVWTPATDWGFAYRLGTFSFPGTAGRATLHVNFAHAWVFGGADTTVNGNVDIAGFSLTFARPQHARK
jgi:hypothetical protein